MNFIFKEEAFQLSIHYLYLTINIYNIIFNSILSNVINFYNSFILFFNNFLCFLTIICCHKSEWIALRYFVS